MARLDESKLQELIEAQNKGIVVGLRDIAGIVPRLDIDVLLHDFPKTFNLFILAFDELQRKSNIDDKMGFFQIAGMKAQPFGLSSRVDIIWQVYMVLLKLNGTGWVSSRTSTLSLSKGIQDYRLVTVHMEWQLSRHGIVPTSRCSKCVCPGPYMLYADCFSKQFSLKW